MDFIEGGSVGSAVILDTGSCTCKAGFAGKQEPSASFPSAITYAPDWPSSGELPPRPRVGEESLDAVMKTCRVVQRGVVRNWTDLERLWEHAFAKLKVDPKERPVLVTEAPMLPTSNRDAMAQLLFETFDTQAVSFNVTGVLSLYATGSRTGIVVESGDGVSHTVPVYDGYIVKHAIRKVDMGGSDLTDFMCRLLTNDRGYPGLSTASGRSAKEQLCYVAADFNQELFAAAEQPDTVERSLTLPDGLQIAAGAERFRCAEALFRPKMLGMEASGLHDMAAASVKNCELDTRRGLVSRVILAGGTMCLPGIRERMQSELAALLPPSTPARVELPENPMHLAFLGASVMASLEDFKENWTSREEYEEYGLAAMHKKCPFLQEERMRD